jgi:PadR family transcriptional regulator, regulatory protein AphA
MTTTRRHVGGLSPEFALLGFLDQNPAHGYELHQHLVEDFADIWNVSQSQVYTILKRLEARGFVQGFVEPQEKRPDRRRLQLTPSGRSHFEAWLYTVAGCSVRAIRVEFMTRLYFLHARSPAAALRLTEAQIAVLQEHLPDLESKLAHLPPDRFVNRMGMALRVRQLKSALGWLQECRDTLRSSS